MSGPQVTQQIEDDRKAALAQQQNSPYVQSLAAHIRKVWEENKRSKISIENEMIECLRQRKGEYDPRKLAAIREMGGSEIYMMLTEVKCRAAEAWIRDVFLQAGDKPWTLEPPQNADLPAPYQQQVMQHAMREIQSGIIQPDWFEDFATWLSQEVKNRVNEKAKEISQKMETVIEDQLNEGSFYEALDAVISDIATFHAGIIKGPIVRKKKTLTWSQDFQPIVSDTLVTEWERVSPLDLYPSVDAVDVQDGNLIERIRLSRADLIAMKGVEGYSDAAIDEVLDVYGRGGLQNWLQGDGERAHLENKPDLLINPQHTIEALQYWGSASGQMLIDWGLADGIDPHDEYQIEAWLIGPIVIRAVLNGNPLGKRPYSKTGYAKVPGSFWYRPIPLLMRATQDMCNAAARAIANNMGIASGPMVEVHADRLAPGENLTTLYPWKIFQTKAPTAGSGNQPAVHFFQPDCNIEELRRVYEDFAKEADNVTGIPSYSYGDPQVGGAGNTASGMSMLMTNASKGVKSVISQIDIDVLETSIERQYVWNMLYNPDNTIKGSLTVVARGASSLVQKEQTQIRRTEFLQMTANPIDMQIIGLPGRAELLREAVKTLDMPADRIVPSRDQIEQHMAQASGAQPPGAGPAPAPGAPAPGQPPGAPGPGNGPSPFSQQGPQVGPQVNPPAPPIPRGRMLDQSGSLVSGQDHALFQARPH